MGIKNIDLFFEDNPNPMWIYDPDTMQVINANNAALELYGYTREEALSLSIKDLRPESEIPKLVTEVEKRKDHFNDAGIWKHKAKDGTDIFVHIFSTPIYKNEEMYKLVLVHNVSDQLRIKEKLDREIELLDALKQNIPGTFYIFDMDGNMVQWNQNLEEITGYTAEEIKQQDPLEYFEGNDRERASKAIEQAFQEGSVDLEASLVTKKGAKIPFYFSASRITLHDKPHLLGVGINISKQKNAQQEVHQQRKLLEAIMEQSGSIIFVKDVDGPYHLVNREFREAFGLEKNEIIGKSDRDLFNPGFANKIIKDDKKVLESGKPREFEEVVPTEKGDSHFFTVKYPLKNIPGYENSICGIASEITELKKTEQELDELYKREKKERHRLELINRRLSLLSELNTIFLEQDDIETALGHTSDLIVHEVAELCSFDIIDNTSDELIYQRITTRHRDKRQEEIAKEIHNNYPSLFYGSDILRQVIENRQQIYIDDFERIKRQQDIDDPTLVELLDEIDAEAILIKPLLVKDREVGTMTFLLSGNQKQIVTEEPLLLDELAYKIALAVDNMRVNEHLKELNQSLEKRVKERTKQLEEANKELESFSYSVSHDLRSPLRAIDGYTSLLIDDYYNKLDEEGQEFLNVVSSEAKRMGELIDDLLTFSRMNQHEKQLQTFSMEQLVEESITKIQHSFSEADPDFHVEKLPAITADYGLMFQVWQNLLGNAVKYRKPNQVPSIKISAKVEQDKNRYVFCVEDDGVGFDMKYADKLFGVFQRLHSDEEFEGTGIGLALVKRIINRHGGETWANSEIGKGTKIFFSLPMNENSMKMGENSGKSFS